MNKKKAFENALVLLYEAMLDDLRWQSASALIDEACGVKGSVIVLGEGATTPEVNIFFSQFCYRGDRREDLENLYFNTYHEIDERLPRIRQLPDRELEHVDELFTEAEKKTSLVYNEALPLGQFRNSLNVRIEGVNDTRAVWVIADPIDDEGWSSGRVRTINRFLPHLRQFSLVREMLSFARAREATFSSLLESTGCGIVQLNERGRIVGTNDRSQAFLNAADGLMDEDAELHAAQPSEDCKLQQLLARALPGNSEQRIGGNMTLHLRDSKSRLVVLIVPIRGLLGVKADDRPAVLVLMIKPGELAPLNAEILAETLNLTEVEAEVTLMMTQGLSPRSISERSGRSYETVRWHLKNVFNKHGVSSQSELARLVFSLGKFNGGRY